MNKEPLVSIIIPNYNHAQYLSQRIDSVLNQTYENYEVIIFDDNSTDNSKEIILKYKNHPKIKHIVYNTINSGSTFKQWEKGFNISEGKLIWIAESDDFCEKDLLETIVKQFYIHQSLSIAYCTSQFVDSNGNKIPPICNTNNEAHFYQGKEFIKKKMLFGNAIWNASSAIFKREIAIQIDKTYTNYKSAGDRLFWIKLAEQGDVIHIKSPKNYFRQHLNKVSPKRLIDGTTSTENYNIFKYLYNKKYIGVIKSFYIRKHNLNELNKIKDMPYNIYQKQYLLWSKNGILSPRILSYIIAIYERISNFINLHTK